MTRRRWSSRAGGWRSTVLPAEFDKASKAGKAQVTALLKKTLAVRVADTRFVLDQLGQLPGQLRGALDLTAVGMFGQSAGGFTAAQTMHDDPRIKAAADLDGVLGYTQRDDDPAEPVLRRHGRCRPSAAADGQAGRQPPHGRVLERGVAAQHGVAEGPDSHRRRACELHRPSDPKYRSWPASWGFRGRPSRPTWAPWSRDGRWPRSRRTSSAFFDRWLRGQDSPLLDGPSARFPEVRFVP